MRILVLGGTVFYGRHIVVEALAAGHEVTLFNRGQSGPGLFPEMEQIHGDRTRDLDLLAGRYWDAVIDPSGYLPRDVAASAAALRDAVNRYIFISTISVYARMDVPGMDESAPLLALPAGADTTAIGENYGPLKAICEREVEAALPGRALQIRPGLIVGPHDPTDRYSYWPWRLANGGEVLAPGDAGRQIQVIDVRDLAAWTVRMAESGATGTFNATGPASPVTMSALLESCREASDGDATLTWAAEEFLLEQKVAPWMEMPLWVPAASDLTNALRISIQRAVAASLTSRPLVDTARDTLDWLRTRPEDHQWRAGLSRQRETEVLSAWHARSG